MTDPVPDEVLQALTNAAANANCANMGVVALCNELLAAGGLDIHATDRICAFMVAALGRTDIDAEARTILMGSIQHQFADMRRRLGP